MAQTSRPTPPASSSAAPATAANAANAANAAPTPAALRLQQQLAFFREHVSPGVEAEARAVQEGAARLQAAVGGAGRLHVLYEAAPRPGEPGGALSVLYSPSVSFAGPGGASGAARLACVLRGLAAAGGTDNLPVLRGDAAPSYARETLKWYPGEKNASESGAQWLTENLAIKEETLAKFQHLSRKDTENTYQKLFAKMYKIMKPRLTSEKGPLRYWRFTPPWLRKNIAVGSTVIILDSDSMPELRYQRNRMGERRLKAVLAAFYEKEALARGVLRELLSRAPGPPLQIAAERPAT